MLNLINFMQFDHYIFSAHVGVFSCSQHCVAAHNADEKQPSRTTNKIWPYKCSLISIQLLFCWLKKLELEEEGDCYYVCQNEVCMTIASCKCFKNQTRWFHIRVTKWPYFREIFWLIMKKNCNHRCVADFCDFILGR